MNLSLLFPYNDIEKNSKIIIYGGGGVGREYISFFKAIDYCQCVMVVDKDYETIKEIDGIPVRGLQHIADCDYDKIIIATDFYKKEFRSALADLKIPDEKIITVATGANRSDPSGFISELHYWEGEFSLRGRWPCNTISRANQGRIAFPVWIMEWVYRRSIEKETHGLPRVLDAGSGPLSMLSYGHKESLFQLTCIDPLAAAYKGLRNKYGYEIDYPMFHGVCEELLEYCGLERFDIVWMQNALDHSQNPEKAVYGLYSVASPGGYIIINGFVREGSKGWSGLHQHDLFLEDGRLCCESMRGGSLSDKYLLDDIEGLKCIQYSQNDGWLSIVYQKVQ